ncbi:MAG: hypothetical protein ACI4GW_09075 [Lachnospiraceae bacterium]
MNTGMFVVILGSAISVYIMLIWGLKEYRNNTSSLALLFSCIALYEMTELIYQLLGRGYSIVMELMSIWILCAVFLKGCVWRSYFFVVVSYFLSNIGFYAVCSVNGFIANIYYKEGMGYKVTIWEGAIDAGICIILTIIVVAILKRFFKGKYRGNGLLYKIFVIIYLSACWIQIYMQFYMMKHAEDVISLKQSILIAPAFFSIVITLGWILIYDYFEKKRIAREREILKNLIREAYRDLNTSGEGQPALVRTGNMAVDSVLSGYTTVFEEQGVIFENDIEPLKDMEFEEKGIVAIIDNLLGMASEGKDKSDNTFVKLSLRNVKGAIIIKIETSKDIIQGKKVFSRSMRNIRDRFDFIKEICDMQDSIISEKKLDEECEIAIVMI